MAILSPGLSCGATPGYDHYDHAVLTDHADLVRQGLRRLLELGRRQIALMSWEQHATPDVFRRVLADAGMPVRDKWICAGVHPSLCGSGWEEFREIWSAYPDKPDGLLVADDVLFKDAIPAILAAGMRVPNELMIVLFFPL